MLIFISRSDATLIFACHVGRGLHSAAVTLIILSPFRKQILCFSVKHVPFFTALFPHEKALVSHFCSLKPVCRSAIFGKECECAHKKVPCAIVITLLVNCKWLAKNSTVFLSNLNDFFKYLAKMSLPIMDRINYVSDNCPLTATRINAARVPLLIGWQGLWQIYPCSPTASCTS